jgi:hypothetical protein
MGDRLLAIGDGRLVIGREEFTRVREDNEPPCIDKATPPPLDEPEKVAFVKAEPSYAARLKSPYISSGLQPRYSCDDRLTKNKTPPITADKMRKTKIDT